MFLWVLAAAVALAMYIPHAVRYDRAHQHGPGAFDGYVHTCKCGHHARQDWDLSAHFTAVGWEEPK